MDRIAIPGRREMRHASVLDFGQLVQACGHGRDAVRFSGVGFNRQEVLLAGGGIGRVDRFDAFDGVRCCFVRLPAGDERSVALCASGSLSIRACPLGGWMLVPREGGQAGYWIPVLPALRRLDELGHVLAERAVGLDGLCEHDDRWQLNVELPRGWCLDAVVWRFEHHQLPLCEPLTAPSTLERQPLFLWGSKVNCRLPADLYRYLLFGELYTDDFVWPRKWKFHSEIDAHGIYVGLDGLETATGHALYGLLRRQVLCSVLLRQADDGGWYHGEWTDLMESHYRLHNSAMAVLEAGLDEFGDEAIRNALVRAAQFLSTCTDRTDLGPWFLHDSLERSEDAMEAMRAQTNTPWIPSRTLGKSPTNKLILNTHLDALIVLDRYRSLTGDVRHAELVEAGCKTATRLLALRPAETLYRWLYRAIALTLLPKAQAAALPAPLRAIKRFTWMYLMPGMHRVKRVFPRLVMPGGMIERHISPLHYDINYHPVNVLDLVRLLGRFPTLDLRRVIDAAVDAISSSRLLDYWSEATNRRFAVVVWLDALYRLCLLDDALVLRQQLARTMLLSADCGLGLPPSLLGGDTEAVERRARHGCPITDDPRLLVANLGRGSTSELLVVNPTTQPLTMTWARGRPDKMRWTDATGRAPEGHGASVVPPRDWLHGFNEVRAAG